MHLLVLQCNACTSDNFNEYLVVNVYDSLTTHCTLQLQKEEEVILD